MNRFIGGKLWGVAGTVKGRGGTTVHTVRMGKLRKFRLLNH